jgi:hypothetical protein
MRWVKPFKAVESLSRTSRSPFEVLETFVPGPRMLVVD